MKAVIVNGCGAIDDVVRVAECLMPDVGRNEVLIEVAATSLNPSDNLVRAGCLRGIYPVHLPYVMGQDASGHVADVGGAVRGFEIGDPVFVRPPDCEGTFAQYISVDAAHVGPAPRSIPIAEAAAIPQAGLSAWQALREIADIQPGQKVLVYNAVDGIGAMAIQLAKVFGAHTTAAVDESCKDIAHALGADEVVCVTDGGLSGQVSGIDVALVTFGGALVESALQTVKPNGLVISFAVSDDGGPCPGNGLRLKYLRVRPNGDQLRQLSELIDLGVLCPLISRQYCLSHYRSALKSNEQGSEFGKIVIDFTGLNMSDHNEGMIGI